MITTDTYRMNPAPAPAPGSAVMSRAHVCTKDLGKQKGAVLVVGLIFLMVITLLALAGMQGVALQGRMSANAYDRNIAFQAAEMALRWAELELLNGNDTSFVTIEQFDATGAPTEDQFRTADWDDVSTWNTTVPNAVSPDGAITNPMVTVLRYDESCFQVYSIGVGRSATSQAVLNSVVCRE